jgi:alkylation response protein AidB-like acyl-CoA dehydrogenase
MDLSLSEEQKLLQDSARRWVEKDYAFEARRKLLDGGGSFSRANWGQFADNGWLAVAVPEAYDGLGGGAIDTAVICEELGRRLVLEPYIPSAVLATQLIVAAASEAQKKAWLPELAAGKSIAAVAYSEPQARGAPGEVATSASAGGNGYVLSGRKSLAVGAPLADLLLVSARTTEGISLFALDPKAKGVRLHEALLIDGRRSADVILENVALGRDALVGEPGRALPALELALDHAMVALCAESVGAMEIAISTTSEYLKTRKQFGVAIGTFQALQHRIADMAIEFEMARSMLVRAFRSIALPDAAERRRGIAASKAFVNQKAKWVTGQAIQLHGGIGMTEEFMIGHYFKRMVANELLFGSADWHLNRYTDALVKEIRG